MIMKMEAALLFCKAKPAAVDPLAVETVADSQEPGGANVPVYSVSEISQALKSTVEEQFSWVRVRGEISGFKKPASGHCYMALKDADVDVARPGTGDNERNNSWMIGDGFQPLVQAIHRFAIFFLQKE